MRRAVLLLLVAGVFSCALGRPGSDPFNDNESRLHERGPRLLEEGRRLQEDDPPVQDGNNVDESEEVATESERETESEENDEETTGEGSDADEEGNEEQDEAEVAEVDNDVSSENDDGDESKNDVGDKIIATTSSPESKVLQTGNKKRRRKVRGPNKKMASKLLPLLMIPLMISAQLIPMMLLKLKLMAVKALMLGKAALVIILLNVLRNAFIGADSMEEQYEQQTLASSHYGYSGSPEYGAWINRRVYSAHPNGPYRGHQFVAASGPEDTAGRTIQLDPATGLDEENT